MPPLPWLTDITPFPPVETALEEPNGLLAAGGDLSPGRLTEAYRQGIFPWFSEGEPILWWSPSPRCVLFPNKIHISRSLRKILNKNLFHVTFDQAFPEVISLCADVRSDTWITEGMNQAYNLLHKQGTAHSVEVWHDQQLVGGLYGLSIGQVFFGESMFSLMTDASKVAFVYLAKQLNHWGYPLIDCQVENKHLLSLGAETIPREHFQTILKEHTSTNPANQHWNLEWEWSKL